MNTFPNLFVSHGAPSLILKDVPARHFLKRLGTDIGRLEAILAVSAHWETDGLRITAADATETIHDFYGFPAPLYDIRYPARNHPTPEHLLPLFVALGTAGPDYRSQRSHNSYTYGVLAMDSFVFAA